MHPKGRAHKMKHWTEHSLMDAVLGELTTAREAELRAHVAECAACREAFAHAKVARAAVDEGMKELVSGEPSANFESRLRARLAAEPAPGRIHQFWPAWAPATAAAFALASTLLIAAHVSSVRNRPAPAISPISQASANPSVPDRPSGASMSSTVAMARRSLQATSRRIKHRAGLEVLVEPGQLEAALQFADAIRTGSVNALQLVVINEELSKPLEIKELQIPPLGELRGESNPSPGSAEDSSSK